MIEFKNTDLAAQQEALFAYTVAPEHAVQSVSASRNRFLGRRKPHPTHQMDVTPPRANEPDAVLGGLQVELDSYLHELPMDYIRKNHEGNDVWCDPLLYWAACTFFSF